MSAILYKLVKNKVESEMVNPLDVGYFLSNGYKSSPEELKPKKPKATKTVKKVDKDA